MPHPPQPPLHSHHFSALNFTSFTLLFIPPSITAVLNTTHIPFSFTLFTQPAFLQLEHNLFVKMPKRIHPPPISPSITPFPKTPSPSPETKINPAVLLVIVILAIVFFLCGFLHLLVRFLIKRPSFYSTSRRYPESSTSVALQRQLQQLFRLHDSGLDQAIIDSLPVFCYKEIVGLNDPFDCAVCLCEFSDQDQLRLLPVCSHAFHVNCIDTWLLSNSTCPLCRGALENHPLSLELPLSNQRRPTIMEEPAGERRVYSVRLGKFRSVNDEHAEEISNGSLDGRRCFSMGACEYVIDESDLLVSLCDGLEVEGKRISGGSKGESLSVSKIWQWSKKGRLPSSSDSNVIRV